MRRVAIAALGAALLAGAASAAVALTQVAADTTVDAAGKHQTLVEPDTFAYGSTIVAAVQSGRYYDGGSSNIAFATSTNAGGSWTSGELPQTTSHAVPTGSYDRLSDPSVAYDARHGTWMISSLALRGVKVTGVGVIVSRSTDGLAWTAPVEAATATGLSDFDKDWIVCDNTPASKYYGRCYVQYDDYGLGNIVHVAYSSDGGDTWTQGSLPALDVLGGQPVVQPKGTVVMPAPDGGLGRILVFRSKNGGATWKEKTLTGIKSHASEGDLRSGPLPSAEADADGRVYLVWADCRFVKHCAANDIVLSTSKDGSSWSNPVRIPIDGVKSGVDHFLPGIAVDSSTAGSHAHLGIVYYYYPVSDCDPNCELHVGWVSSTDGGKHWTPPTELAGPMSLDWLPQTSGGRMVGDYMSASFAGGTAFPAFVRANAPTGSTDCNDAAAVCDLGLYVPTVGLAAPRAELRAAVAEPVLSASGDRVMRRTAR